MRQRALLTGIGILCLFVGPLTVVAARGVGDQVDTGQRYVASIGVDEYGPKELSLQSARRDAEEIHEYLSSKQDFQDADLLVSGKDTELTKKVVLAALAEAQAQSEERAYEDVVFFFSGQGVARSTESGATSYLLLGEEWESNDQKRIDIEGELLPLLSAVDCKRMYILLDANRRSDATDFSTKNEDLMPGVVPLSISSETAAASEGVFVVYASAQGTASIEIPGDIGLFARTLLDGMEIYNNYYDVFGYLDRSVPLRSFAYGSAGRSGRTVQYIDFGGDFSTLSESGYSSYSALNREVRESGQALREVEADVAREEMATKISSASFSVGVGMLAGSAASLAVLNTLSTYYSDAGIRRATNISWGVLGASFIVLIPSAILFFMDM